MGRYRFLILSEFGFDTEYFCSYYFAVLTYCFYFFLFLLLVSLLAKLYYQATVLYRDYDYIGNGRVSLI